MTPHDYLDTIKERLVTDELVSSFHVIRERATTTDGHLRVRSTLSDGSMLEFSEYIQLTPDDEVDVVTYSYHWADAGDNLIRRWDNTPHFPDLAGFPHHIHDGPTDTVRPGEPLNIFIVLDEIEEQLA